MTFSWDRLFPYNMFSSLPFSFCSYRRKLRAMKALKVASKFSENVVQQGPAIPGTNIYSTERYISKAEDTISALMGVTEL